MKEVLEQLEGRRKKLLKKEKDIKTALEQEDYAPFVVSKFFLVPLASLALSLGIVAIFLNSMVICACSMAGGAIFATTVGVMNSDYAKKAYKKSLQKKQEKVSNELMEIVQQVRIAEQQQAIHPTREETAKTKTVKQKKKEIIKRLKLNDYETCKEEIEKLIDDDGLSV